MPRQDSGMSGDIHQVSNLTYITVKMGGCLREKSFHTVDYFTVCSLKTIFLASCKDV